MLVKLNSVVACTEVCWMLVIWRKLVFTPSQTTSLK